MCGAACIRNMANASSLYPDCFQFPNGENQVLIYANVALKSLHRNYSVSKETIAIIYDAVALVNVVNA